MWVNNPLPALYFGVWSGHSRMTRLYHDQEMKILLNNGSGVSHFTLKEALMPTGPSTTLTTCNNSRNLHNEEVSQVKRKKQNSMQLVNRKHLQLIGAPRNTEMHTMSYCVP